MYPVQHDSMAEEQTSNSTVQPPAFERRESVAGNILCVDETRYFWLQRKIRTTASNGSIRAGFCLTDPVSSNEKSGANGGLWEVVVAEQNGSTAAANERHVQMVAIRIEKKNTLDTSNELAALQWIARTDAKCAHVQHSVLAAADAKLVYTVTPYEYTASSTLYDFCSQQPNAVVPEATARLFFRQIILVRYA